MNYIVKMINGGQHTLTDAQYRVLMEDGEVVLRETGEFVAKKSVSNAYPESREREVEGQPEHVHGILHDGSRVIRQFGEWFAEDGQKDEKGRYLTRLDPEYYPEAALDRVPSVEEFEKKYRALPTAERRTLMVGEGTVARLSKPSGFTAIGPSLPSLRDPDVV